MQIGAYSLQTVKRRPSPKNDQLGSWYVNKKLASSQFGFPFLWPLCQCGLRRPLSRPFQHAKLITTTQKGLNCESKLYARFVQEAFLPIKWDLQKTNEKKKNDFLIR